ncbi:transposase, partial [Streptomyces mirabilis]|uniref:transposase n=1 Tax=Streptomyces mirabilis TaxID=68239 RepID=UPI0036993619
MGTTNETGPHENTHQVQTGAELARAAAEQNRELAEDLIERARRDGLQLVGENGLLTGLVKLVLEGALEAGMAEHLGYEKGDPAGTGSGNQRNGTSRKTVLS